MGGYGSGRKFGKPTTSGYLRLDVRRWQREGLLTPGASFTTAWTRNGGRTASIHVRVESGRVILCYQRKGEGGAWESLEYPVYLDATGCNYGGERAWFLCPAQGCGKRAAILYGGKLFACRDCHRLAYPVQRETASDRAIRRAGKIRARLGWDGGILYPPGDKPKGMHWQTFWKLHHAHAIHAMATMNAILPTIELANERGRAMLQKYAHLDV